MSQTLMKKAFGAMAAAMLAFGMMFGAAGCSAQTDNAGSAENAESGDVQQVTVTVDADNNLVVDKTEVEAGNVTFTVSTESAAVTEIELLFNQRIIGEKENLAPGLEAVSFTKRLDGGDYLIYAPGAENEYVDFKVTGEAAAAPEGTVQEILTAGVADYAEYAQEQLNLLVEGAQTLQSAIDAGNIDEAKAAWASARAFYEHAESMVDGFIVPGANAEDGNNLENLDYLIDMRESSLDDSLPADKQWHGFHAIERDLWERGEITDQTKQYAADLVKNAKILAEEVAPDYLTGLDAIELANG
ncbi:MAG: hypothetical protein IJV62_01930, partial [Eggerthellaceae bacterium]|nr:hypothetical protein [Eggerthellaceae bacterium]